jgi:glycosyltransferase involved in cell wall biosynthesis
MVDSVLDSTFSDFEIIIVNDGSSDNTKEILDQIENQKIKIIHTGNNGPASARNLAIENAGAEIILNLDADDKIKPDYLEKAYKLFSEAPNAGIISCDAECFGAGSGKFEIGKFSLKEILTDNRINSQSFFKKLDWKAVGGYSSEMIYGLEDWDFWLSIIALGREVIIIPESLVCYRTYKNKTISRSGRRKKSRLKMEKSMVLIFRRHKELYKNNMEAFNRFSELEKTLKKEKMFLRFTKSVVYKIKFWLYS